MATKKVEEETKIEEVEVVESPKKKAVKKVAPKKKVVKKVEEVEAEVEEEIVMSEIESTNVTNKVGDTAVSFLDTLVANRATAGDSIDSVGSSEMKELQTFSKGLKKTIISMEDANTKVITNGLVDMKTQMDDINPGKFDFEPGWIGRLIQRVTGKTAMNKYVTKFQTADSVIASIDRGLEEGKVMLKEDNVIFKADKYRYLEVTETLSEKIKVLLATNEKVDIEIPKIEDEEKKKFLQEEVSYRLKQQIQDLQQTLVVTQQGVIAIDILIKNNDELIRSVNRVQRVTMAALSIGATLAVGLANQKKVLDTTNAINEGTSDLISANANLLKTQGAAIQKQASGAMLNIDKLQSAITDTIEAIEDVESFKVNALPEMSKAISELNSLTTTVDSKIKKIGKATEINLLPKGA